MMLVLSRKEKETIKVGDSIVICVVSVKGNRVRLGVQAPSDVKILRGEIELETPDDGERKESAA